MLRKPAVAGFFYQGAPARLTEQVRRYIEPDRQKMPAIGILSPHAGLIYSGAVAGAVYSRVKLPDTFILIGPNHTGIGASVSVFPEGSWDMPNGAVQIDAGLAQSIVDKSKYASADYDAHAGEHSLEVQIPFIQYFKSDFKIVPITMMTTALEACRELGHALSLAVREAQKEILIIASSDMTHYEPARSAKQKDTQAIDKILSLSPAGLYETVRDHEISMCGFAPAVTMLYAAIDLGAKKATLIKYMNSGEVSGDAEQVVGYAGIVVN